MNRYRLSNPDHWKIRAAALNGMGGVYIIRCLKSGVPDAGGPYIPIPRLLDQDQDGILYIGKGKDEQRLATLIRSISPLYRGSGHSLGDRYKADPRIRGKFPYENLEAEIVASDSPDASEREYLKNYELRFGELPPFNHSKRRGG